MPIGPDQQYIGEQPLDRVTLYVYAGANGRFSLYEDDGLTYGYEKREYSRIPMAWDDASRTLTSAAGRGRSSGMLRNRTFDVVLVSPAAPRGYGAQTPMKSIAYSGAAVRTRFE